MQAFKVPTLLGFAVVAGVAIAGAGCGSSTGLFDSQDVVDSPLPNPDGFTEYDLRRALTNRDTITWGPDGNVWFTETLHARIGRLTPAGAFTEFELPDEQDYLGSIASGPDGNLWFTVYADKIGRMTPAGDIAEFPVSGNSRPHAILEAPDGHLWFTQSNWNGVGRISVDGDFQQVDIYDFHYADELAVGPDTNLWILRDIEISRVTLDGTETRFAQERPGKPETITAGPDGALWYTFPSLSSLGRITTNGAISELVLPQGSDPFAIVSGPDGRLWFTELNANRLTRLEADGAVAHFEVPTLDSSPARMTVGADGALWFIEASAGKIGRLVVPQ